MRVFPLLILVVLLCVSAQAQSPRSYEPFHPTAEFVEALSKVDSGQQQVGIDLWLDIARRNPGTTLGAESLARAACFSPLRSQSEAILRQISQGYPGSRFDLQARQNLISLQHGYQDTAGFIQATDSLIQSFGAPGLQEIQRFGQRGKLVERFHSLPLEI